MSGPIWFTMLAMFHTLRVTLEKICFTDLSAEAQDLKEQLYEIYRPEYPHSHIFSAFIGGDINHVVGNHEDFYNKNDILILNEGGIHFITYFRIIPRFSFEGQKSLNDCITRESWLTRSTPILCTEAYIKAMGLKCPPDNILIPSKPESKSSQKPKSSKASNSSSMSKKAFINEEITDNENLGKIRQARSFFARYLHDEAVQKVLRLDRNQRDDIMLTEYWYAKKTDIMNNFRKYVATLSIADTVDPQIHISTSAEPETISSTVSIPAVASIEAQESTDQEPMEIAENPLSLPTTSTSPSFTTPIYIPSIPTPLSLTTLSKHLPPLPIRKPTPAQNPPCSTTIDPTISSIRREPILNFDITSIPVTLPQPQTIHQRSVKPVRILHFNPTTGRDEFPIPDPRVASAFHIDDARQATDKAYLDLRMLSSKAIVDGVPVRKLLTDPPSVVPPKLTVHESDSLLRIYQPNPTLCVRDSVNV